MRIKKEKIEQNVSHETSTNRVIENGEIWTKESSGYTQGKKQRDRIYIVIGSIIDDKGKAVVMRDFDSHNLVAKDQATIETDPYWNFHPQASIEEEVVVTKKINLGGELSLGKPKAKWQEPSQEIIQEKDEEHITWGHYGSYRYSELEILGTALIGTKAISDPMYKKKWKNGFYQAQGMQALDMWRDKDYTIRHICNQQPYVHTDHLTKEETLKVPAVQTMVRRIAKAIMKHGTKEEKQLLFYPERKH